MGVFTNLIAVPLSGPILILGLLGSLAGNIHSLLAYPLNACNGFLTTILIQTAQAASSLPFASVTGPGVTLLLVGMYYAGCVPPIFAGRAEIFPLFATSQQHSSRAAPSGSRPKC